MQLYGKPDNPADRQFKRFQATDQIRIRGTAQTPPAPRDVMAQSGPRGVLLTWSLPDSRDAQTSYVTGYRVYKNDEQTMYAQIKDRGTRSIFVETSAGSTPPPTNFFVSCINALGMESTKTHVTWQATTEAGAPTMPNVPNGYNQTYGGGGNHDNNQGHYGGDRGL